MKALTGSGRAVAAAAVLLAVGADVLHYPELVALSVGAAGAVLVALVSTGRSRAVRVERALTRSRVSVGDAAEGVVTATDRSGRGGPALRGIDRVRRGVGPAEEIPVVVPAGGPGEVRSTTYPVPTGRRGVFVLGPLVLERVDPLGLAHRELGRAQETTLWVHPRVHVIEPPAGGRRAHPEGGDDVASPQATTTFESLREYVIGDDLRRIHWRSTAHTGSLMVRNDLDTAMPTCVVWLDADARSYDDPEQFEEAVEVAASVMVAAVGGAVPVRLLSSSGLDADGTRYDRGALLDRLATVELHDGPGSDGGARLHDPRPNLMLVVVTGPAARRDAVRIDALCRRFGEATELRIGGLVGDGPERSGDRSGHRPGNRARAARRVIEATTAAELCRRWNRSRG